MRAVVQKFMQELRSISVQKQTVKSSIVSDAAKRKLLAELDARVAEISAELEALDIQGQTGAVQAPQTAAKRP